MNTNDYIATQISNQVHDERVKEADHVRVLHLLSLLRRTNREK